MPAQCLANVSSALSIRLRVESLPWWLSLEDNKFCVRAGVGEFLCGVNRTTQVEAAVDQDIDQRRQAFVQRFVGTLRTRRRCRPRALALCVH